MRGIGLEKRRGENKGQLGKEWKGKWRGKENKRKEREREWKGK